jgi:hypothetical protein
MYLELKLDGCFFYLELDSLTEAEFWILADAVDETLSTLKLAKAKERLKELVNCK